MRATQEDYDFDRWLGHSAPGRMHLGPREAATVYADRHSVQRDLDALSWLFPKSVRLAIEAA